MKKEYPPDSWLPLSGIQHFLFCRRQWALIHVEQQWRENALTAEGRIMHKRADDPFFTEKREGIIISRAVPVSSPILGLSGICDVVEFRQVEESSGGVQLPYREGRYQPFPVEYKRGREKQTPCDEAQLCAQAMCLEEMLTCSISIGFLYYGQTRRRVNVDINEELRGIVSKAAKEMHAYAQRGYTPRVKPFKGCRSCSMADVCLPMLHDKNPSASVYIRQQVEKA